MALIYRRFVLLTGARAQVQSLARGWETVIEGWIGRNPLRIGEYYTTYDRARERRLQINTHRCAFVVSVEEILYPLALIHPKYATDAPQPLPNQSVAPYSRVSDVYSKRPAKTNNRSAHNLPS